MARALISSLRLLTGKLVETLTQHSEPESSKSNRVRLDLEHLHRTLRRIQAVLQDAEDREIRDESVQIWLSDLRGVAYEAQDVLDEYQYELMKWALEGRDGASLEASSDKRNKRKMEMISTLSSFASSSSNYAISIADISASSFPDLCMVDRLKGIKDKFQEIFDAREQFSLRDEDGERRFRGVQKRPPSTSLVREKDVIGREEDKQKVINLLNSQSCSFVVIPIVGMGGVGKTTLAQLIYNDSRVCQLFDQRAWVSVSDDFDVMRLTREIIESITEKSCYITQPNMLQEDLMGKLKGRKFLLVLDDVWNEDRNLWEHFIVAFKSAKLVTILTTSRCTFTAQIMHTVAPYHLDSLLEDQSWILFKNCVFGTQNPHEQSDLVPIGEKIVRKCGGLPLAIKALGGVLRYERDRDRWIEVLKCYIWELDEGRNEIISALKLSYYMMPSHLRPCFLYFSMFPKDKEFERDQVVRFWMAQGYINAQSNKRLEDIGRKYFDELYGRSLLLSFSKWGQAMYKMHAMIYDLAASFSTRTSSGISYGVHHLYTRGSGVLTDFLSVNNPRSLRTLLNHSLDSHSSNSFVISLPSFLRVLDVDLYGAELPDSIGYLKHLRYLCVTGHNMRRLPESLCLLYNLQTLDLRNCFMVLELPRGIGNLVNLRFLRLYSHEIRKLPDSICLLRNLQILDLKCCSQLSELPSGIEQLISLRYLDVYHSKINSMIPGIGMLTELQNLQAVLDVKGDENQTGLGEVKDLINLRGTLCISGLENVVDVGFSRSAHMISKHDLENVKLRWRVNPEMERYYIKKGDEGDVKLYLKISSNSSSDVMECEEIEEAVLESLQPSSNVMNLTIHGYNGLKFPGWFGDPCSLARVSTLVLEEDNVGNDNLSCLGKLPSLKTLVLVNLGIEVFGDSEENKRNCGEVSFPSLETLECRFMGKWKKISVVDRDFPRLSKLMVEDCPALPELQIFPSLHSLYINECASLRSLTCKHNPENNAYGLRSIVVKHCPISFYGVAVLSELEELVIRDSNLSVIYLPIKSKLHCVHIAHCGDLKSIVHLENIYSIRDLRLTSCPQLYLPEIMPTPDKFQIVDCAKLKRWSLRHKFNYFQNVSCKELRISTDEEIRLVQYDHHNRHSGCEYLCTKPYSAEQTQESKEFISYHFCTVIGQYLPNWINHPRITSLELLNCKKVISIDGLNNLSNLKHLTIWECPDICQLGGEFFPSTLECFTLKECDKLRSIPSFKYSNALREVQLWNCVKLTTVMDLHCSICLKTLMVIQCWELCFSPIEMFQAKLEDVVIRDCPMIKDWCRINNIPYIQWFNDVPNEEEDETRLQLLGRLTNLNIGKTGAEEELLQAQRQLINLMIKEREK